MVRINSSSMAPTYLRITPTEQRISNCPAVLATSSARHLQSTFAAIDALDQAKRCLVRGAHGDDMPIHTLVHGRTSQPVQSLGDLVLNRNGAITES